MMYNISIRFHLSWNPQSTYVPYALTINSINTGALVIAAQQKEILRILDLVGQQQTDRLQRLLAAIHIITKEQIIGSRRKAAIFE